MRTYTTLPDGTKVNRGRGWGCLSLPKLGGGIPTRKGKMRPGFVAAICESAHDYEPPKPKKRGRPKKGTTEDVELAPGRLKPLVKRPAFPPPAEPAVAEDPMADRARLLRGRAPSARGREVELEPGRTAEVLLGRPRKKK